jgi:antitoxin CptB
MPKYKRQQLLHRCKNRGFKEIELVLSEFGRNYLDRMNEDQLKLFSDLLDSEDPDLYDWMMGNKEIPEKHDNSVWKMFLTFRKSGLF